MPTLSLPLRGWPLYLLLALFLLPGLVGHDPWKGDDAIHIGAVLEVLRGHGIGLYLAGQVFPEPPLYHWCAALVAWPLGLLPGPLTVADAVRLSNLGWLALSAWSLTRATQAFSATLPDQPPGEDTRRFAGFVPLLLFSNVGLLVHAHEAQPQLAVLACLSLAWWGLATLPERPGRVRLALGLGLTLPAGGLAATLPLLLALPFALTPSRGVRVLPAGILASLAGIVLALLWPLALLGLAPAEAAAWWRAETQVPGTFSENLSGYLSMLPWHAWPALPLALWGWWRYRAHWLQRVWHGPLVAALATLPSLSLLAPARSAMALTLLPPLVLMAALGLPVLRRGSASALDWFGRMSFSVFALMLWLSWVAMNFGWPAQLAHNITKIETGFRAQLSLLPALWALALSLAWVGLLILTRSPRHPDPLSQTHLNQAERAQRAVTHWMAGLTLIWGLTIALLLPWIEYGQSYRDVAREIAAQLPAEARACVNGLGLGEPQRAAFDYFIGLRTQHGAQCRWLLTQGSRHREEEIAAPWVPVWEGHRAGDRTERFRLYQRRGG